MTCFLAYFRGTTWWLQGFRRRWKKIRAEKGFSLTEKPKLLEVQSVGVNGLLNRLATTWKFKSGPCEPQIQHPLEPLLRKLIKGFVNEEDLQNKLLGLFEARTCVHRPKIFDISYRDNFSTFFILLKKMQTFTDYGLERGRQFKVRLTCFGIWLLLYGKETAFRAYLLGICMKLLNELWTEIFEIGGFCVWEAQV